jgi:hypothetical protein
VPTSGTFRSTSSRRGEADCSRSVRSRTVTSAGTSLRSLVARLAVTTVSPTRGTSGAPTLPDGAPASAPGVAAPTVSGLAPGTPASSAAWASAGEFGSAGEPAASIVPASARTSPLTAAWTGRWPCHRKPARELLGRAARSPRRSPGEHWVHQDIEGGVFSSRPVHGPGVRARWVPESETGGRRSGRRAGVSARAARAPASAHARACPHRPAGARDTRRSPGARRSSSGWR